MAICQQKRTTGNKTGPNEETCRQSVFQQERLLEKHGKENSISMQLKCRTDNKNTPYMQKRPFLSTNRASNDRPPCKQQTATVQAPSVDRASVHPPEGCFPGQSRQKWRTERPVPLYFNCKHFDTALPDSRIQKNVPKKQSSPSGSPNYAILGNQEIQNVKMSNPPSGRPRIK